MEPSIRVATLDDLPALHRLIEGAYRGDSARRGWTSEADLLGGQRTDPEALTEILTDPAKAMLVAEVDGVLVGCVLVADLGGGRGYFGMLSVDPDRQAAGLGKRLLAAAEQHLAQVFNALSVEMNVFRQRSELIAWYERRGYRLTGREVSFPMDDPRLGLPLRDDLVFLVMEKSLT